MSAADSIFLFILSQYSLSSRSLRYFLDSESFRTKNVQWNNMSSSLFTHMARARPKRH